MTALKPREIDGFIARAGGTAKGVLIYGPDEGLVRERADALAKKITPDLKDAFNFIELTGDELKADPSRLADELAAISMMGGRRVVRARLAGESLPPAVKSVIDGFESGALDTDSLLIVMAGALSKRSALRKAFESAKSVAAAPCYEDRPAEIRALAAAVLREAGVSVEPDALAFICETIGGDRMIMRGELEKIVLFAGENADARLALEDVKTLLGEAAPGAADDAAALATAGAAARLAGALDRTAAAGASPIAALRSLSRRLDRLHIVQAALAGGASQSDALRMLRPPLFFAEADAFKQDLRRWPEAALRQSLIRTLDAERAAKRAGAPQWLIVERAFFETAARAGGGRRGTG